MRSEGDVSARWADASATFICILILLTAKSPLAHAQAESKVDVSGEALSPSRSTGTVLDRLELYGIVLKGEVAESTPYIESASPGSDGCRFCTALTVRKVEYLLGAGPDTVKLRCHGVSTSDVVTSIDCAGPSVSFAVPVAGDRGIFFISRTSKDTELWHPSQMSVIHDDWVTAIGLPLVEVEEAVRREASSRAQAPRNTTGRVVQGNVVGLEPSCSRIDGRPCDCYTIAIDQQLAGAPIDSSEVVVMMPSEYYRKRWEWRGLFILGEVPGDTRFKVMDPRRQLIEEVSGQYVVGYQIVSSTWLDRVAPITVPLSEVRE